MKKLLSLIIVVMAVLLVACQKPVEKEVLKETATTSDAAVDAVGNDLNDVTGVEEELNTDDLNDVESGLNDVENI
jgi:peptidoglycan hydrolase CwlO-like protein